MNYGAWTMRRKIFVTTSLAALAPLAVFLAWAPAQADRSAVGVTLLAALAAAAATAGILIFEITDPVAGVTAAMRGFLASDCRLESPLPKRGGPEARALAAVANRLMLELSAFRAFQVGRALEERGKAQALMDAVADGVMLVDEDGGIIQSNSAARHLLGITELPPSARLPAAASATVFVPVLTEALSVRSAQFRGEVAVPSPDDAEETSRSYRVTCGPFPLATLKNPGRLLVIRDITMEKEIESARETVFHMITHDMRAPVCSIEGYAHLLKKAIPPTEQGERCLDIIMRASKRLSGMIEDILNTIKLEHGTMTINPASVDGGELCSRVVELHKPMAERRRIAFSAVKPSSNVVFSGDPVLLERVVTNLVGNSLKFTPPGGAVTVSCRREGGEAIFLVEDNGPGIPQDKLGEIFKKYAQLDEHRYMGFGLGLAMCKMAVELHRGRIWVESQEGKGSRFMFTVPMRESAA